MRFLTFDFQRKKKGNREMTARVHEKRHNQLDNLLNELHDVRT